MYKQEIRKVSREIRASRGRFLSNTLHDLLLKKVLEWSRTQEALTFIHTYEACNSLEIPTQATVQALCAEFNSCEVYYPRVNGENLESVKVSNPAADLLPGSYNIPEPQGAAAPLPDTSGVIFVPLLGVDAAGCRVGYGKGFYDRFLQSRAAAHTVVGLSYEPPLRAVTDREAHDIPVDVIIWPYGIHKVR
jgi:5,10-methenyltetrahydrofolate synthetase